MKEIKVGDWIEVNINNFLQECKIEGWSERGIEVSDGVREFFWIEWEEIDKVRWLVEG